MPSKKPSGEAVKSIGINLTRATKIIVIFSLGLLIGVLISLVLKTKNELSISQASQIKQEQVYERDIEIIRDVPDDDVDAFSSWMRNKISRYEH